MFALLAIVVPRPLVRVAVGLLVGVGLLDLLENAHFLAMLAYRRRVRHRASLTAR